MKRVICLCSLMLMLFAGTIAFAEAVQPLYLEADRVSVSLDINCDGAATCKGKVRAKHSNVTMNITLTLKKSSDGKTWNSVKSWNDSGNGLLGVSIEEACAVSKGYQYKEERASLGESHFSGRIGRLLVRLCWAASCPTKSLSE